MVVVGTLEARVTCFMSSHAISTSTSYSSLCTGTKDTSHIFMKEKILCWFHTVHAILYSKLCIGVKLRRFSFHPSLFCAALRFGDTIYRVSASSLGTSGWRIVKSRYCTF